MNLSQYGFRPKQVLKQRGALKKYFDGISAVENNQQSSKTWVRDFCKWNWIHSCKQVFVKSYELNYWYQELGGKFTVFLEIKKSEIKNQNRKKDNSHIIGNRKAKSGNPKAKSEKKTTSLKSEKRKSKSEKRKFFQSRRTSRFLLPEGLFDNNPPHTHTQEPDAFLATSKSLGWFLFPPYSKLTTQGSHKHLVTLKTLERLLAPAKSSGSWGEVFIVL